jgi:hypothetical protein
MKKFIFATGMAIVSWIVGINFPSWEFVLLNGFAIVYVNLVFD